MEFKLVDLRILDISLKSLVRKELPIAISYKLAKFVKQMSEELTIVEEQRIMLVKKYSGNPEVDETGEDFNVKPDKEEQFRKEFGDLLMQEVEIDFEPIALSSLGEITLPPIDLAKLDKIIALDK